MKMDTEKKRVRGPYLSLANIIVRKNGKKVYKGIRKEVNVFLGFKPYSSTGYRYILIGQYEDYTFEFITPLFKLYDDSDGIEHILLVGTRHYILDKTGMLDSTFSHILHGRYKYKNVYKIERIQ